MQDIVDDSDDSVWSFLVPAHIHTEEMWLHSAKKTGQTSHIGTDESHLSLRYRRNAWCRTRDVIKTLFMTKTKSLKLFQDLFVMYSSGRTKMQTKMKFNLRPKTKRNCTWTFIFGQKRKRKSPDNINVFFFFFTHSVTKSAHNAPPIPRPVLPFLQLVLVDGIPLSSCTVYRYLCGIFLDDISTREQFAFLIYWYRVKAIFTICGLCFTGICGITNSPHC